MMLREQPTTAQIKFARSLMDKLGYDEEDITQGRGVDGMIRIEVARLIHELKDEWEGDA